MPLSRRHAVVLTLLAAAAGPAAAQPPQPNPWRFGTEVAFTDISGNRDLQLFQSTLTAVRQTPESFTFDSRFEARYGESNGVEAARSAALRLRFDWTPQALVSPFLGLDVDYDHIRLIDVRVAGGVGANFNLSYSDRSRLTVALGVVEAYENRAAAVTPNEVADTRVHTRLFASRTLRTGVVFELAAKYQPSVTELSDYLFKADGAVRVALTTRLSLRSSYSWNRDSTPAPGVRKDDRALTTGLLISW